MGATVPKPPASVLSRSLLPFILLFGATLLLFKLGSVPLFEPDEGRYGNISQTMLASGDWITPRKNGFAHFHKPPLPYWAMAFSQKLLGSNELGVRFPGVLFGLGILLASFGISRIVREKDEGYFVPLLLLATPLFLFMSRLATTDIGMVFWVTLAVYCFVAARKAGRGAVLLGTYASLGCAMMTKGPVPLALYFLAIIPLLFLVKEKNKKIPWFYHGLGLGLFLIIALPWYLWVIRENPGLLDHFLVYQTKERIATTEHHPNSLFYFLPLFLGLFAPWSLFLPAVIREYWSAPKGTAERQTGIWFVSWALLVLLFFSLVPSKLASYILPMSVPFALALSGYFTKKISGRSPRDPWFYGTAALAAFIFWLGGLGLGIYTKFFLHERIEGLKVALLVLAYLLPLAGLAAFYFIYEKKVRSLVYTLLITVYAFAFVTWIGMTQLGTYKNVRPFVLKVLELRKPGEAVISYRKMFPGLPFYLKERVIEVGTKTPAPFDSPEVSKRYRFEKMDAVDDFILSPQRCFIVTKMSDAPELESRHPGKLKKLLEGNKVALYSNQ